jgi:hypothetical protein
MSGMEQLDNAEKAPKDQTVAQIDVGKELNDSNLNQQVFKGGTSDKVPGVHLESDDVSMNSSRRRIEPPHAWYENSKPSYHLPSEAAISGGVRQALVSGWRRLDR